MNPIYGHPVVLGAVIQVAVTKANSLKSGTPEQYMTLQYMNMTWRFNFMFSSYKHQADRKASIV